MRLLRRFIAGGILLLVMISQSSRAADPSAIGGLELGSGDFCNGTLIASRIVLTAAHCLTAADGGTRAASSVRFHAGLRGEIVVQASRLIRHPDFDISDGATLRALSSDLGIVVLIRPVPVEPFNRIPSMRAGVRQLTIFFVSGRRGNPDQATCPLTDRRGAILTLGCRVEKGVSGAPVLLGTGPDAKVVAVVSARARTVSGGTTSATRVDLDREWLNELIFQTEPLSKNSREGSPIPRPRSR